MANSTPNAQKYSETSLSGGRGRVRVWAAIVVGLVLSVAAFQVAKRAEDRRDEERFKSRIDIYTSAFRSTRSGVEDVMKTLRALFSQNPQLSREMFHDILRDLAIRTEGLQALVWAPRIQASEREALELRVRGQGLPSFQLTEGDLIHAPDDLPQRAADRSEYFPVLYLEPQLGNESAFGYDLGSIPQGQRIIRRSTETGDISASARVSIRYQNHILPGCIVAIPVFQPELRPGTPDDRRRQSRGFVIAVLVFKSLMAQIMRRAPGLDLEVMLIDRTPGDPPEVLDAPEGAGTERAFRQAPHSEQSFGVAGRTWLLLFRRGPSWQPAADRWHPYTLLLGGIAITLLAAWYLRSSTRRAQVIERLVVERTAELEDANVKLHEEIRDRIQAQSELAHDRRLLRTLIDRLPDSVFVTDEQGRYLTINQAHCRLLNIDREEDGLLRPVGKVGAPGLAEALDSGSAGVMETGAPALDREVRVSLPGGRSATLLVSKLPLPKSGGGTAGLVVLCRDVTAARAAEMEKQGLAKRLQETQKLESLGLLAGGIAHDFNNLLTSVLGNVGLARMEIPPDSPALDHLEQIESTGVRASDLCKQMLAYSGKGRFVVRRIDLSRLVEDTTELLRLSVSKKAKLVLDLAPGLPPVSGDATQLRQILMNLVINASEALGEKSGVIRISTGAVHADREYIGRMVASPDVAPGDYLYLEVSDSGSGMDPETQARIFDPFFTTKFAGRGLGLAAVIGIVRGHKGAIKVYSEPGKGSTFKLLLPRVGGTADPDAPPTPSLSQWRGTGVLLVVDDEEPVRRVASRILEKAGFEVVTASDGREGVDAFAADPQRYAAVLLDLTMPHMDGEEAFREMRRIRPDARILLMSGFSSQEASDRFAGSGLDGFLQKPFSAVVLTGAVRDLLEGPAPYAAAEIE